MPQAKIPYECPRCGYTTQHKPAMRKHLYDLKKVCPGQKSKIVLTTEIKEEVMRDRVYIIQTTEQDDNGKCTMNFSNCVFGMDPTAKVEGVLSWSFNASENEDSSNRIKPKPINFGDHIERIYGEKIQRLEDRSLKYGFQLKQDNFFELVDESIHIKSVNQINQLNLLHIKELNKIAIYHDDEWTYYLFDSGLNQVINILKNYYLESYEKYILYKIFVDKNASPYETNLYKNLLNEYFNFLAIFDVYPSSKDLQNSEFMTGFQHDNNFYISDFCMDRYNEEKQALKRCDINRVRKIIGDIIKNNNGANIKLLNQHIIDLAINDESFKTHLLSFART